MSKVKNILFRIKLEGKGIVNFDSSDQKFMYNGTKLNSMKTIHDNTNYAKKNFYKNGDDLTYKLKISSNSLRHAIFEDDVKIQSPNIIHQNHLLHSFIASPASLLRGYMFASKKETIKRKSPVTITDAEQTCNAQSYIETFSRSGDKETDADTSDNTFYKKETVGDIKYEAIGNIDLAQLQFISCDQILDRYSFNPDFFNVYKQFLKTRLPNFDGELGYYQMSNSILELSEYGFKIDSDNVNELVRGLFKRILTLNIKRNTAFAMTNSVEYKLVYDVLEDTFDNEDGWVTLKTDTDINNLSFDVEDYYVIEDIEVAKGKRQAIEAEVLRIKEEAKAEKAKKAANKKKKTAKA